MERRTGTDRSSQDAGSAWRRCAGFSLAELCICLGITGIIGGVGTSALTMKSPGLTAVQQELEGAVQQAFLQARAQGRDVQVALGSNSAEMDVLPVKLPGSVRWGKPARVPLPPGMEEPKVASLSGEAHARITVTPRHTATATVWFLNDGEDVLCLRLGGHGQMHMLRWRQKRHKWGRA